MGNYKTVYRSTGVHCSALQAIPHPLALPTHLMFMLAVPMSPVVENLTPSLVAAMSTVSPMLDRSLQAGKEAPSRVKC
jgi:hypothetical protein